MKKIQAAILAISALCFLASCSETKEKKVLVMASGKVQVNDHVITLDPGTTHTENEINVTSDKLTVQTIQPHS